MAQGRLGAANQAQIDAQQALVSGIGNVVGGVGSMVAGLPPIPSPVVPGVK